MKNELRELAEKWRTNAKHRESAADASQHGGNREWFLGTSEALEDCADELEAALSAEPDSDGERLSDAACDAIARALDAHGRDKLGYGGGLPAWDEECFIVMRHLIRDAARSAAQEK